MASANEKLAKALLSKEQLKGARGAMASRRSVKRRPAKAPTPIRRRRRRA